MFFIPVVKIELYCEKKDKKWINCLSKYISPHLEKCKMYVAIVAWRTYFLPLISYGSISSSFINSMPHSACFPQTDKRRGPDGRIWVTFLVIMYQLFQRIGKYQCFWEYLLFLLLTYYCLYYFYHVIDVNW